MKNVLTIGLLVVAFFGVRYSLPENVQWGNMHLDPNASPVAKTVIRVAFATGLPQQEVYDFGVFKTADLRLGDKEIKLVALPGTKWMRYE
jgi:hypothetical protein